MSDVIPNEHTEDNKTNGDVSNGEIVQNTNNPTPEPIIVNPIKYAAINETAQRSRNRSIYQKYEDKVPKKHKNIIANIISSLMIVSLWTLFLIPSALLIYAIVDYYLYRLDPLSNDTVSSVFRTDSCPGNPTIQSAVREMRRVANGEFNATNFSCVSTFVSNGTQCVPECVVWYPGGEVYFYLGTISVPILSFITLVAVSLGATTWLCLKSLWKFPHIISLYLIVCVIIQELMIFIGSVNRRKFFCSSRSLFASQMNPNIQCQIQGPIYHYFVLSFMCWYICDIFNIVYVLLYPMKAIRFLKHSIKIHIVQSLVSWGLPILTIGTVLGATSKYKHYTFPILCFPDELSLLFSFYIPGVMFSLLSGTGLILLGLILYKRHKKIGESSTTNVYQTLLRQLIVYSIALSVLIFILLIQFTITSYNFKLTEVYETAYNWCITAFYTSPQCCFQAYTAYYTPFWNLLNEATFCCWGVVALSVVWVKDARMVWLKVLTCAPCRQMYQKHKTKNTGATSK